MSRFSGRRTATTGRGFMRGREARFDRAAVDHDRGAVEAAHGDEAAGHVLVAAGEGDQRVVPLGLHDGFDASRR